MKKIQPIAPILAGASVAAFILAEFGLPNSVGWQPTYDSAIYLCLLSLLNYRINRTPTIKIVKMSILLVS
ncbi:hypothetical protein [Saccharospirillum mangrovi]|uniref:hypothetical protein n=1 Tax=Saccharospirillum mangrovi TaxID=2161747 RepID=UPI00130017A0|nr:hypothetical protein [Saccharospirillum mangrovi]